jgi:hypothetical protein
VSTFTLYIKRKKGAKKDSIDKAILHLKPYLEKVIAHNSNFTGADAVFVEDGNSPALIKTDVIVYLVESINSSVIEKNGGNVAIARSDGNVLGLTDLNKKICEVYYDRLYEGSPKELAGACYHEAAHIKSNQDNAMHTGKDGFLGAKPDYNGSPNDDNNKFLAKHLGRELSMTSSY